MSSSLFSGQMSKYAYVSSSCCRHDVPSSLSSDCSSSPFPDANRSSPFTTSSFRSCFPARTLPGAELDNRRRTSLQGAGAPKPLPFHQLRRSYPLLTKSGWVWCSFCPLLHPLLPPGSGKDLARRLWPRSLESSSGCICQIRT
jgi:hypothetical protein